MIDDLILYMGCKYCIFNVWRNYILNIEGGGKYVYIFRVE